MKKRKPLFCLIVLFCMALALPAASAARARLPFTDVGDAAWYRQSVQYVYDRGLMSGTSATTFDADDALTRAMFVTILGRIDGVRADQYASSPFRDVPHGQWFSPYVQWAAAQDIVSGYGNRRFGPDDPVTREQLAAILSRYLDYRSMALPADKNAVKSFGDIGSVSAWAKDSVNAIGRIGLLQGDEHGNYNPAATATRAEVSVVCMKLSEMLSQTYFLYGDAVKAADQTFELTDLDTWKSGSIWLGEQVDPAQDFTICFSYCAGGGRDDSYGGADGIILAFSEKMGLGADGEYLGFVGGNAYGVEFDSYPRNPGDPDGKHIAVIYGQPSNHLCSVVDDRVDDSAWHDVRIEYSDARLRIYLDEARALSCSDIDFSGKLYLGLSAATGSGKNQHLIRGFTVQQGGAQAGSVELYAGPGEAYAYIGSLRESQIDGYTRQEGGWIEVEYENRRAYVRQDALTDPDTSALAYVSNAPVYGPTQRPHIVFFRGLVRQATCSVPVRSGPGSSFAKIDTLRAGDEIQILWETPAQKAHALNPFLLIEYQTEDGPKRGYADRDTVLDVHNPLRGFDKVKESNAAFNYAGERYYSTAAYPHALDGWKTAHSASLTDYRFDFLAAITGAIGANDSDIGLTEELWMYSAKANANVPVNTQKNGNMQTRVNAFIDLFGMVNAALESGNQHMSVRVDLQTCDGEGRILLRGGTPLEAPYAGKKNVSLSSLIAQSGSATAVVESGKRADALIRSICPEISGDGRCDMLINFSNDFADNPYGYYFIFDRSGTVYGQPILHPGTQFLVYQSGELIADLGPRICSELMQLSGQEGARMVDLLAENGITLE